MLRRSKSNTFKVFWIFVKVTIFTMFKGERALEEIVEAKLLTKDQVEEVHKQYAVIPGSKSMMLTMNLGWKIGEVKGMLTALIGYASTILIISYALWGVFIWVGTISVISLFLLGLQSTSLAIFATNVNDERVKNLKTPGDYVSIMLYFALFFTGFPIIFILVLAGLLSLSNYYYQRAKPIEFIHKYEEERIEESMTAENPIITRENKTALAIWLIILLITIILNNSYTSNILYLIMTYYISGSINFLGGIITFGLMFDSFSISGGFILQSDYVLLISLAFLTPDPQNSIAILTGISIFGIWGGFLALVLIGLPSVLLYLSLYPLTSKMRRSRAYRDFMKGVTNAVIGVLYGILMIFALDNLTFWKGISLFAFSTVLYHYFRPREIGILTIGGLLGILLFRIY